MHGSALPVISTSQVKTLIFEEEEGYRLISLGSHVHHIDAEVVLDVHVRTMFE